MSCPKFEICHLIILPIISLKLTVSHVAFHFHSNNLIMVSENMLMFIVFTIFLLFRIFIKEEEEENMVMIPEFNLCLHIILPKSH
jgi:hypothetical protein